MHKALYRQRTAFLRKIMNPKKRPNHRLYIETLRKMTPEKRLLKAFELSSFSNQLFVHGLRKKLGDISALEFAQILKDRLDKCHNRNF